MSNTTGCGAINVQVYEFTTQDAGKQSGTAYGNLPCGSNGTGSQVSINGTTDLSKIIVGPNGACVQSFIYQSMDGIARNSVVYVFGQGPQGMGSGSLYLTFSTSNGEHDLSLTSSSPDCHNDKFDDGAPITKITWQHT